MHIHLDAIGGVAGDMFVAALLDLAPEHATGAIASVRSVGLPPAVTVAHTPFDDGVLTGSRFLVTVPAAEAGSCSTHRGGGHPHDDASWHAHEHTPAESNGYAHPHAHPSAREHGVAHPHVRWSDLRGRLMAAPLARAVRERSIAIFTVLAHAEARVHGKPIDTITFHEVGAWDSIADIVAAAWLIEESGATSWSVGPLPLGSGRVRTAHGLLPAPAPATVLLLEGLPCFDDGRCGERITPTGAAILRHLAPSVGLGIAPRMLARTGHGFGARRLSGMSNVLRMLSFEDSAEHGEMSVDQVTMLAFEVDDQTAEDLALGLERLRALPGVIDVVQGIVIAKHGRQSAAVRVLAAPAASETVAAACFRETTTLGIRVQHSERRVLTRDSYAAPDGTRVKCVRRPGQTTAKAELADLAGERDHAARERRRRTAEGAAFRAAESCGEAPP